MRLIPAREQKKNHPCDNQSEYYNQNYNFIEFDRFISLIYFIIYTANRHVHVRLVNGNSSRIRKRKENESLWQKKDSHRAGTDLRLSGKNRSDGSVGRTSGVSIAHRPQSSGRL